ncbi:MAG: hypothetical protein KJ754_04455, partial [Bacteroidetes bacterium]|nr:hypothetical protein [Bacteroidota bacterium]MBU1578656.1 hypothetical protein [Bacteroidota bacterium]MBU2466938.1 hypothetical protein [Bacteroidota bacterium]
KRGIVPDYLNMQFAGNIGSGSIGAGYYLNPSRTLFFDAVYGYSPAFRSGRAIHNIVVRLVAKPYSLNLKKQYSLKPLLSIAVSKQIADDDRTFSRLPKNFPEGYYAPNAFRLHFDLGLALRKDIDKSGIIKAVEFYANTTTNEMYVTYFIRSQSVNLGDIFSLTLGFNLYLFE